MAGPGIDADVAERIFDPFFTTKDIGRGTGLGLSVAAAIIGEFGGSLEHEASAAVTTFVLRLPNAKQGVETA